MAIEFIKEAMTDISVISNNNRIGYIFLDDIRFNSFTIEELEQILNKMKELREEKK